MLAIAHQPSAIFMGTQSDDPLARNEPNRTTLERRNRPTPIDATLERDTRIIRRHSAHWGAPGPRTPAHRLRTHAAWSSPPTEHAPRPGTLVRGPKRTVMPV